MADDSGSGEVLASLGALEHEDGVVRGRAIDALAATADPKLIGHVRPLLDDVDWVVAFKAAAALAWSGDESGGPILIRALVQPDLCFIALEALTALGSPLVLPELQQFFRRRRLHPLEKLQAAAALHRSGDTQAVPWMEQRLAAGRPEERGFALELWGRWRLPGALERLRSVLVEQDHPHRMDALRGLAALADPRALPLIERVGQETGDTELAAEARAVVAAFEPEEA